MFGAAISRASPLPAPSTALHNPLRRFDVQLAFALGAGPGAAAGAAADEEEDDD
jgi:hypothetical protein